MSSKSPVFPMLEPQHFSDYGFDPQIDYFQVLEEARKHKRETIRTIDTLHFKLQKPISKDDQKNKSSKKKRRWWWKNAAIFFKSKWAAQHQRPSPLEYYNPRPSSGSISGPIYVTESLSGSTTPYRTTSGPVSGPLAGTMTPTRKGDLDIPYISLKDLNMDPPHVMSSTPMPIYLVT
ncbi:hypothetical protein RND81_05G157100 [Saponaria officinalis]|uniref:Uncharacterized protein n=1 Tax=Saponaria officinalis TaxID=3572 RepID=A0AAW1KZ05_SAPOF